MTNIVLKAPISPVSELIERFSKTSSVKLCMHYSITTWWNILVSHM